jgi:hypothetical protein
MHKQKQEICTLKRKREQLKRRDLLERILRAIKLVGSNQDIIQVVFLNIKHAIYNFVK